MDEVELLKRQLAREKNARAAAEALIEQKSSELYQANVELQSFAKDLMEKEEKTRAILGATSDGILVIDNEHKVGIFNSAACSTFGRDSLKDIGINELIEDAGDSKKKFSDFYDSVVSKSSGNFLFEAKARRLDETNPPIEIAISRIDNIKEVQAICVIRNIFERKQAEIYLALQHTISTILAESLTNEEAMPSILKLMGETLRTEFVALWKVDEEKQLLYPLAFWNEINTKEMNDFVNISRSITFGPNEGLPGRIWSSKSFHWIYDLAKEVNYPRLPWALKAGLHSTFAFPIIAQNKVLAVLEFVMVRFCHSDDNLIKTLNDIGNHISISFEREKAQTETKKYISSIENLLTDLKKVTDEAETANRTKSEFLANMSHELRTPLNAIIGYSELMLEDAEADNLENYVESLKKVIGAGKHLLTLINDVLDLSKIEAGKIELYLEDVSLNNFVKDLAAIIVPLMEKNNNKFIYEVDAGIATIYTDLVRIRQSLLNLLSNASKFTKGGQVSLKIFPDPKDKSLVVFSVSDTGIGMTPAQMEKLFQAFSQVDASTTRKYGGTGLGLYLTKRFIEMLGGTIEVKSQEGEGTNFTICLPIHCSKGAAKISAIPSPSASHLPSSHVEANSKKKILIINENASVHQQVQEVLEPLYEVIHAYNGEEGLNMARKLKPDGVILDIVTRLKDGFEILTGLKSDEALSKIPIVLMSLFPNGNKGYALGSIDYLNKPINGKLLIEKITNATSRPFQSILVVDDDLLSRELMCKIIKAEGGDPIEAANGAIAVEWLKNNQPSLILLDLMMPEMNGFAVLEALEKNEHWHNIPVIIVTAKDLSAEERLFLQAHTKDIIQKGENTRKELLDALHRELN